MKTRVLHILIFCFFTLHGSSCGTNGGIEAGNPNLEGKSVTLESDSPSAIFVLKFGMGDEVEATKIQDGLYETIETTYEATDSHHIKVDAKFGNGIQMETALEVTEAGEIVSAKLKVNGLEVDSTFETQGPDAACETDDTNAAVQATHAICSRIVDCNTTFVCEDCIAEVLVVPGLAKQFGNVPESTLQETAEQIDNGTRTIDEAAFQDCLEEIKVIPCSLVQEHFNDTVPPQNYNPVKSLIPKPSCSKGALTQKN